jgi:TRAP-type C4-dicarboxylate transport system permease small subunit
MNSPEKAPSTVRSFTSVVDQVSLFLGRVVMGTLIAMMILICTDIFLRLIFRKSIMGATEITGHYFMVAVVFLPLAYGMITRRGHIRVDFVITRLPSGLQLLLETLCLFLSLGVYILITWYGWVGTLHAFRTGERMVNIALPMWPGRVLVVVGGSLLCVQIVLAICRNFESLFGKTDAGV